MMRVAAATSEDSDTHEAIDKIIKQLGIDAGSAPDFLSCHSSVGHSTELVRHSLAKTGAVALHGATSCQGVMSNDGMVSTEGYGMGALAIWDTDGNYGTGIAAQDDDPRSAAREATIAALDAAGRSGEVPELLWIAAAPGREEDIIAGIEEVVGAGVPILGGSAADNDIAGGWSVFDRDRSESAGVVVSALFPSRPLSSAYQSGYAPVDKSGHVTRAEGRRIIEIDGEPAADVYARWTNGLVTPARGGTSKTILSCSTMMPLGREAGHVADVPYYVLAHPAQSHPDGSIELFADVAEGEELRLMIGAVGTLTARAGKVATLAMKRGQVCKPDVAGALVIYCGGCMLAVREHMDDVARGVDEALGGAPFLGVFTFGEQGPVLDGQNRHGNLMISCVTFAQ